MARGACGVASGVWDEVVVGVKQTPDENTCNCASAWRVCTCGYVCVCVCVCVGVCVGTGVRATHIQRVQVEHSALDA